VVISILLSTKARPTRPPATKQVLPFLILQAPCTTHGAGRFCDLAFIIPTRAQRSKADPEVGQGSPTNHTLAGLRLLEPQVFHATIL